MGEALLLTRARRTTRIVRALLLGAWLVCAFGDAPRLTVLDLQKQRRSFAVETASGTARLDDLAPGTGAWYLLTLHAGTPAQAAYHIESVSPRTQTVAVDAGDGGRLVVRNREGDVLCSVPIVPATTLDEARHAGVPDAAICQGRLYVRNALPARRTALAITTQFLRDHVWHGEDIVGFVKREFYSDAFAVKAQRTEGGPVPQSDATGPADAVLGASGERAIASTTLGLEVAAGTQGLRPGRWTAVRQRPGIHVAAMTAAAIVGSAALAGTPPWRPDAVEADALAYIVAFDLSRFDVGFALGTDHPRLGWSERVPPELRDPALPGPDGIDSAAPLVRTGVLAPFLAPRVVATFTGGFKREHGAFRYGELAREHHGSHYGFIEQGVVFSTLQPGLATWFARDDGFVDIRTWTDADRAREASLRFARQNGVPLVQPGPDGRPRLGALVDRWGGGNWSGSADERLRTLRAGACILEHAGRRFLAYAWFSDATPGTMARMLLALGCRDAMHLDMNALEHTYLAVYVPDGARMRVEHLVDGMAVLDRADGGTLLPRFIAFPDDRDFFYVLEKVKEAAP